MYRREFTKKVLAAIPTTIIAGKAIADEPDIMDIFEIVYHDGKTMVFKHFTGNDILLPLYDIKRTADGVKISIKDKIREDLEQLYKAFIELEKRPIYRAILALPKEENRNEYLVGSMIMSK